MATVDGAGLVATSVSKWFGATPALREVDLAIRPGRVVALVGHNGAGKSTLMRTLSGAAAPTSGRISVDGRLVAFTGPADASAAGIACVHQELSLIDELSVAQNVFLGAERRSGPLLDRRAMREVTEALCAEYRIGASATTRAGDLPVARRQLLEVARAMHRDARFLLLDEPTTALEQQQIDALLDVVRRVCRERGVGVLLINHKLDEVYAVADDIVGLANGRVVLSGAASAITRDRIVGAIVGTGGHAAREAMAAEDHAVRRRALPEAVRAAEPALRVRGLAGNGLVGVELDVRPGEVVGIYGLVGSGRSRFLRTLYGAEPIAAGEVTLHGRPFRPRNPAAAIAAGVAFVSEERKSDGLLPQLSSLDNIVVPVLDRFTRAGLLSWPALRGAARGVLAGIAVRGDVQQPIAALSGGNQQKVLFARAMLQKPALLLLDEPTKGVDIGAKAEIYELVRTVARDGRAVVVVSSEEEELLEIADRVVVFVEGRCDGIALADDALSVVGLRRAAWSRAS